MSKFVGKKTQRNQNYELDYAGGRGGGVHTPRGETHHWKPK